MTVQRATEKVAFAKLKELAYIRQEIKNPLYGIMFTRNLMEETDLSEDQRQFVETSAVCERQLRKILDDMDLESIEDGLVPISFPLSCSLFVTRTRGSVLGISSLNSPGLKYSSQK